MAAPRRQWMRFVHLHYVVNASVRVKRLGKVVKRFRLYKHSQINVPIQPMEVYVECYCCGGNQQLLLNRPTRLTVPGLAVSPLFQYVSGRVVAKSDLDFATFLNAKMYIGSFEAPSFRGSLFTCCRRPISNKDKASAELRVHTYLCISNIGLDRVHP